MLVREISPILVSGLTRCGHYRQAAQSPFPHDKARLLSAHLYCDFLLAAHDRFAPPRALVIGDASGHFR